MVLQTALENTHVLITGGTKGIGKSIVAGFLAQGANVSYCARTVTGQEFAEAPAEGGAKAMGTSVDVSDQEAVKTWVQDAAKSMGRIDTVVANASPMLFDESPESWNSSFQIDLLSLTTLVNTSISHLLESPNPSVIIISSFMGREFYRSPPAPYGPMKAAQLQHVQELSHYLGPKGVRINAVSPGPIIFPGGAWEQYQANAPEWVEEQRKKVALRRLGKPEEVANSVIWLASRLASYVTGGNLLVDGGIHVGTQF